MRIHQHAGILTRPLRRLCQGVPLRLVKHGRRDVQLLKLSSGREVAPDLIGKITVRLYFLQSIVSVLCTDDPVVHQGVQREQRAFAYDGAISFGIPVGHPLLHWRAGTVQVDIIALTPD